MVDRHRRGRRIAILQPLHHGGRLGHFEVGLAAAGIGNALLDHLRQGHAAAADPFGTPESQ